MKAILLKKVLITFFLLILGVSLNAQIKFDNRGFLTFGSTATYNDGSKNYDMTLKGNIYIKSPVTASPNNFFQIDTNSAATRLASHYDQVVFYNSSTGVFNSIQVKNVYNYSDARAKTNIQPLSAGLNIINKFNPVSYTFANNIRGTEVSPFKIGGDGKELGLLAQDVEKVLPNVVITDPNGNKLINYTALISVLINAVNELSAKVEALEAQ